MPQTNVRDVGTPDMVGVPSDEMLQEVRVHPMQMIRLARILLRIQGFKPHETHQTDDMLATQSNVVVSFKRYFHPARAVEGILGELNVDGTHRGEVCVTRYFFVVDT